LERIWGFAHRQEFGLEAHAQAFVRRRPDGRAYEPEELPIERALVSGENVQGDEMVFEVPDGRRVRTLVSATPVYAEDGRITSAIAIIQELASVGPLAGPTPSVPTEAAQIPVPTGTATETALRIECASATDRGRVRETNEDAVYCEPVDSERVRDRGWLCAVADGMGGAAAGEVASDTALRTLVQHYYDPLHPQNIHEAAQAANAAVHEAARGRPEYEGMGTTLTAAAIVGERLHIAHVGDSRAYLVRRGEARQITQDHSWVAELVRAGALTNEQARAYRYRNILSRALGRQPEVDVDGVEHNLEPGDRFVLCSDGLSNLVGDGEIARVASSEPPQAAADGLVELANSRGGLDNISAIVVAIS
jgi:protein phosphatase